MTFCASPDCKNKCGKKLTEEDKKFLDYYKWVPVSMGYFCGNEKGEFEQNDFDTI